MTRHRPVPGPGVASGECERADHGDDEEESTEDLRRRRDELEREIAAREGR